MRTLTSATYYVYLIKTASNGFSWGKEWDRRIFGCPWTCDWLTLISYDPNWRQNMFPAARTPHLFTFSLQSLCPGAASHSESKTPQKGHQAKQKWAQACARVITIAVVCCSSVLKVAISSERTSVVIRQVTDNYCSPNFCSAHKRATPFWVER